MIDLYFMGHPPRNIPIILIECGSSSGQSQHDLAIKARRRGEHVQGCRRASTRPRLLRRSASSCRSKVKKAGWSEAGGRGMVPDGTTDYKKVRHCQKKLAVKKVRPRRFPLRRRFPAIAPGTWRLFRPRRHSRRRFRPRRHLQRRSGQERRQPQSSFLLNAVRGLHQQQHHVSTVLLT